MGIGFAKLLVTSSARSKASGITLSPAKTLADCEINNLVLVVQVRLAQRERSFWKGQDSSRGPVNPFISYLTVHVR